VRHTVQDGGLQPVYAQVATPVYGVVRPVTHPAQTTPVKRGRLAHSPRQRVRAASVPVQLTMTTEDVPQVDRGPRKPSAGATGRPNGAESTRSTTLRPEIRLRHVYVDVQDARYLAEDIAPARLAILPGAGHVFTLGDHGATADATLASLNKPSRRDGGRFLTTVLMTDMVDSTQTVARLGDRRWREVLTEHYADCRARVDDAGGELVNTTGDGILAIFECPTRAVRAAMAIQAVARASGMAVRAGVHTGECEWLADGLAGLAVHVAARICALGNADDVITTATVRDLVTGSMLAFEPQARHELKGVPGEWTIFRATDPTEGFRSQTTPATPTPPKNRPLSAEAHTSRVPRS
jgi:class 3 adenylate cyclase